MEREMMTQRLENSCRQKENVVDVHYQPLFDQSYHVIAGAYVIVPALFSKLAIAKSMDESSAIISGPPT
jgi:hypothetical protein